MLYTETKANHGELFKMSPEGNGSPSLIGHIICTTISCWDIIFPRRATETAFYECNFKVMSFRGTLGHLGAWVFEYQTTNHLSSLWWCQLASPPYSHRLQPDTKQKAMTFQYILIFMPLFPPRKQLAALFDHDSVTKAWSEYIPTVWRLKFVYVEKRKCFAPVLGPLSLQYHISYRIHNGWWHYCDTHGKRCVSQTFWSPRPDN